MKKNGDTRMATTQRKTRQVRKIKTGITQSYCIRCGRYLDVEEFYKSPNPYHATGYMPYCKSCAQDMMNEYMKEYGNLEATIFLLCADLGIPFIRQIYDELTRTVQEKKTIKNFIGTYIRLLVTNQTKAQKEKWKSFGASDSDFKEIQGIEKADKTIAMQKKELEILWGKQFDTEQLAYLEYRYTAYTQDLEMTEFEENLYRNLCKAELQLYEQEDIENATKRQMQLAKVLGIDNFDKRQDKSLAEKILENEIFIMEEHEPAEYFAKKEMYRDFRGIRAGFIFEILRPIKNLLFGTKDYNINKEETQPFDEEFANIEEFEEGLKTDG